MDSSVYWFPIFIGFPPTACGNDVRMTGNDEGFFQVFPKSSGTLSFFRKAQKLLSHHPFHLPVIPAKAGIYTQAPWKCTILTAQLRRLPLLPLLVIELAIPSKRRLVSHHIWTIKMAHFQGTWVYVNKKNIQIEHRS